MTIFATDGIIVSPERLADFALSTKSIALCRAGGQHPYIYGHLNRQSDKYLRTTFVEAAYLVIRHDPELRAFYEYLRAQKGHGCAICAVARKLARSVYWMLKNSTPYRVRRIQPQYVPKPGAKLTIRRLAHSTTTA